MMTTLAPEASATKESTGKVYYRPLPDYSGCDTYWVPLVVKSWEFLYAFLLGVQATRERYDETISDQMGAIARIPEPSNVLSSSRFNDYNALGKRDRDFTPIERQKMVREAKWAEKEYKKHPDNDIELIGRSTLNIACACGNYIEFKEPEDIPRIKRFICDICGRTLIEFTGLPDSDFIIDRPEERKQ
jgi:hypothetical protein